MIYHTKSKTMIITPTRCGSVTLHETLTKNENFINVTTYEYGRNTIHGSYNSIDKTYFKIDKCVLLIRNPIDRLTSIFNYYKYKDIKQFLNDFDQYDRKFKPCCSYLHKIGGIIKTENLRVDVNDIFGIDFEQLDVIYENSSNATCNDVDAFKSLSRTIYSKDELAGGYNIV